MRNTVDLDLKVYELTNSGKQFLENTKLTKIVLPNRFFVIRTFRRQQDKRYLA